MFTVQCPSGPVNQKRIGDYGKEGQTLFLLCHPYIPYTGTSWGIFCNNPYVTAQVLPKTQPF